MPIKASLITNKIYHLTSKITYKQPHQNKLLSHHEYMDGNMLNIDEQFVLAVIKGDMDAFERLLNQVTQIDLVLKDSTALGWAAHNGHIKMVKALIKKGANVNSPDSFGNTPLHWALFNYHHQVAEILIAHGANQLTQNKNGLTPKQFASIRQRLAS